MLPPSSNNIDFARHQPSEQCNKSKHHSDSGCVVKWQQRDLCWRHVRRANTANTLVVLRIGAFTCLCVWARTRFLHQLVRTNIAQIPARKLHYFGGNCKCTRTCADAGALVAQRQQQQLWCCCQRFIRLLNSECRQICRQRLPTCHVQRALTPHRVTPCNSKVPGGIVQMQHPHTHTHIHCYNSCLCSSASLTNSTSGYNLL